MAPDGNACKESYLYIWQCKHTNLKILIQLSFPVGKALLL